MANALLNTKNNNLGNEIIGQIISVHKSQILDDSIWRPCDDSAIPNLSKLEKHIKSTETINAFLSSQRVKQNRLPGYRYLNTEPQDSVNSTFIYENNSWYLVIFKRLVASKNTLHIITYKFEEPNLFIPTGVDISIDSSSGMPSKIYNYKGKYAIILDSYSGTNTYIYTFESLTSIENSNPILLKIFTLDKHSYFRVYIVQDVLMYLKSSGGWYFVDIETKTQLPVYTTSTTSSSTNVSCSIQSDSSSTTQYHEVLGVFNNIIILRRRASYHGGNGNIRYDNNIVYIKIAHNENGVAEKVLYKSLFSPISCTYVTDAQSTSELMEINENTIAFTGKKNDDTKIISLGIYRLPEYSENITDQITTIYDKDVSGIKDTLSYYISSGYLAPDTFQKDGKIAFYSINMQNILEIDLNSETYDMKVYSSGIENCFSGIRIYNTIKAGSVQYPYVENVFATSGSYIEDGYLSNKCILSYQITAPLIESTDYANYFIRIN